MRTTTLLFSAIIAASSLLPASGAQAQSNSDRLPGSSPSQFYSTNHRNYMQGYVRNRTVPSVTYDGQIAVGTQLPSTYTYYDVDGNPEVRGYRYGRFNNRYIVIDSGGRVVDMID